MPELNSNYKVVQIMQVTDVKVKIMRAEGNLKAYASVTFDDEFVVKDIKVIDGKNGLFIAMPSKPLKNRRNEEAVEEEYSEDRRTFHKDIAHPINAGAREKIQFAILAKYEEELKNEQ